MCITSLARANCLLRCREDTGAFTSGLVPMICIDMLTVSLTEGVMAYSLRLGEAISVHELAVHVVSRFPQTLQWSSGECAAGLTGRLFTF